MINIKKYLKNDMDFNNLINSEYSYPSIYKDFIKLKLVEKKIMQKNKKIIFIGRLNLVVKILDLKCKIPKQQNSKVFILVIKFPKIKLIGKKAKTIFVNKTELIGCFFFESFIYLASRLQKFFR